MFTGIITQIGAFAGYRKDRQEIRVSAPSLPTPLSTGESLAVNGVCLSVIRSEGPVYIFNMSKETVSRTNLGKLKQGDRLNLEQPLTLSQPLGGHLVSGHIDGTEKILRITPSGQGKRLSLSVASELRPYVIPKGSVAVNGISLTVASLSSVGMDIEVIPITLEHSNLKDARRGDIVNIECDMIGKYVYNWISQHK